jgi:hypothetical protein
MKKILSFIALIAVFASCTTETRKPPFKTKRVRVLENNTISYIHVPFGLDSIYKYNDTVWVNMITHKIDDIDTTTMMCVIDSLNSK